MIQPLVEPNGCDVLVWDDHGEFYFAAVNNGIIYHILDGCLAIVIDWLWLTYEAIGFIIEGHVARTTKNSLQ